MIKVGDKIPLELGGYAEVKAVLGSGGQGTVYRALYRDKEYALKMYFTNKLKRPELFRENLTALTDGSMEYGYFVMPLLLTDNTKDGFGFLMDLIPEGYAPFSDILNARVRFSGL